MGDRITAGDIYGIVNENSLVEHRIMLPPGAKGTISYIAPSGHYDINEEVIEVEFAGTKKVRDGTKVCVSGLVFHIVFWCSGVWQPHLCRAVPSPCTYMRQPVRCKELYDWL